MTEEVQHLNDCGDQFNCVGPWRTMCGVRLPAAGFALQDEHGNTKPMCQKCKAQVEEDSVFYRITPYI